MLGNGAIYLECDDIGTCCLEESAQSLKRRLVETALPLGESTLLAQCSAVLYGNYLMHC